MKAKQAPKDLTLIQLLDRFATDDKARAHLESVLWKDGIVCPKCQCKDQSKFSTIKANPEKKVRAGLRWCSNCKKQFTVTIGTIFEDSHIPLRKWLIAWYLLCSSKKGISSLQIKRILEIGCYGSALHMMHAIRTALLHTSFADKLNGVVEADEVALGGKPDKNDKRNDLGGYRINSKKVAVMTMLERGGRARSQVLPAVNGHNLRKAIRDNVQTNSELHTDMHLGYGDLHWDYQHHTVKHRANEYRRVEGARIVTTNNVESFFSLLRKGITGIFHHVSPKYLPLYLAEFDYRWSYRKSTDGERTDIALPKAVGKRLMYGK